MTTRVLVCGGREYGDIDRSMPIHLQDRVVRQKRLLFDTLSTFKVDRGISVIIQGGAKGADECALHWATRDLVPVETFKADWKTHGKAAGPIRNQRMIDEGKPDVVIVFPGGRGTADMVQRARADGIEVIEVQG